MFENLKETISVLVDKEIEKKKNEVINKNTFHKGRLKADIDLLDSTKIQKFDDTVSINTLLFLGKEPHFKYNVLRDKKYPDEGYITVMAWLSDDFNQGIVASTENYDDDCEVGHFKVHRRGKNGRGVSSCSLYDNEKNFLKHYDNFVAEIVLLGLDETSTESKE